MAEVLGAAASGISIASFAVQIVDSGIKLNRLWNAIKDAPEDIAYLKEDVQSINTVLEEIKAQQALTTGPSSAPNGCLELCRRAAETLENVVKDLETTISKKRLRGSMKVALKRETLAKHRTRLSDAKTSLILAQQMQFV